MVLTKWPKKAGCHQLKHNSFFNLVHLKVQNCCCVGQYIVSEQRANGKTILMYVP